jgi:hypothetical protein
MAKIEKLKGCEKYAGALMAESNFWETPLKLQSHT